MAHDGRPRLRSFVFSLPTNIKKLTLSNFGLPWSEISRIAELSNLGVLKLLVNSFMGNFLGYGIRGVQKAEILEAPRFKCSKMERIL